MPIEKSAERAKLYLLSDIAGPAFGTENFCLFLHAFVCMTAPTTIVELGTGLGVSAMWMAAAAKSNGIGHVWTVDDFEYFTTFQMRFRQIAAKLHEADVLSQTPQSAEEYYTDLSRRLDLEHHVTFVKSAILLVEHGIFDGYPFNDRPIDLLFTDFAHGASDVLAILKRSLLHMSSCSSIFIHSASTHWSSYLLLEQLIGQLNAGKIPKSLQSSSSDDLGKFIRAHRFVLVHLVEHKTRHQNSAAWIKIEPVDVLPHPISSLRGIKDIACDLQ